MSSPTETFRSVAFSSTHQLTQPNTLDSTPRLGYVPFDDSPKDQSNSGSPQAREFVRFRAPTMSMVPVEDIPLPPKMHRTFNPDSKTPMVPNYEFDSLLSQLSSVSLFPNNHSDPDMSSNQNAIQEENEPSLNTLDQNSIPLTTQSQDNNSTHPKKTFPNLPAPDKLIVYGPTGTTLNTSLGIPVNGLAKSPSLLRQYSYKHRPKTGPRPPANNDPAPALQPCKDDETAYTEYHGQRCKTTASRPAHKELARKATLKATLKAIRDEIKEEKVADQKPRRRNRAYTVASSHPTASISPTALPTFAPAMESFKSTVKSNEIPLKPSSSLQGQSSENITTLVNPFPSDRIIDLKTFLPNPPVLQQVNGSENQSSSVESLKPLTPQYTNTKPPSSDNAGSSDRRLVRKGFNFSFSHYKSNSLTKLSPSISSTNPPLPTQLPPTHTKQKSSLTLDTKNSSQTSLQDRPIGFSANQTLPLTSRGPYSPVTANYYPSLATKKGTGSNNSSHSRLLDIHRKKKKSSDNSLSNSSSSSLSGSSVVSGIGSINGFERDRLEKNERSYHVLDHHVHSTSIGGQSTKPSSADSTPQIPRKSSSSSSASLATSSASTDIDTLSSMSSLVSSSDTCGTASSSLVSPTGAASSGPELSSSSIGLSHFLPFTVASRTAATSSKSKNKKITVLLPTDQKPALKSNRSNSPNQNISTLGSGTTHIKISNPIVTTGSAPIFSPTETYAVSKDFGLRRTRRPTITNAGGVLASGFQADGYLNAPALTQPKTVDEAVPGTSTETSTETKPIETQAQLVGARLLRTQKPDSSFTRISPATSPLMSTEIEDSDDDEQGYDDNKFGDEFETLQKVNASGSGPIAASNGGGSTQASNPSSDSLVSSSNRYVSVNGSLDKFSCSRPLLMSMQVVRDSLVSVDDDTLSCLSGVSGMGDSSGYGGCGDAGCRYPTNRPRNNTVTKNIFQEFENVGNEFQVQSPNLQQPGEQLKPEAELSSSPQIPANACNSPENSALTIVKPQSPANTPSTPVARSNPVVQPSRSIDSSPTIYSDLITPTGVALTTSKGPTTTVVAGSPSTRSPSKIVSGSPAFHRYRPSSADMPSEQLDAVLDALSAAQPQPAVGYQSRFVEKQISPPAYHGRRRLLVAQTQESVDQTADNTPDVHSVNAHCNGPSQQIMPAGSGMSVDSLSLGAVSGSTYDGSLDKDSYQYQTPPAGLEINNTRPLNFRKTSKSVLEIHNQGPDTPQLHINPPVPGRAPQLSINTHASRPSCFINSNFTATRPIGQDQYAPPAVFLNVPTNMAAARQSLSRASALYDYELDLVDDYIFSATSPTPSHPLH